LLGAALVLVPVLLAGTVVRSVLLVMPGSGSAVVPQWLLIPGALGFLDYTVALFWLWWLARGRTGSPLLLVSAVINLVFGYGVLGGVWLGVLPDSVFTPWLAAFVLLAVAVPVLAALGVLVGRLAPRWVGVVGLIACLDRAPLGPLSQLTQLLHSVGFWCWLVFVAALGVHLIRAGLVPGVRAFQQALPADSGSR
jgi:hypothetical protein